MFKKILLLGVAAAVALILSGCELFGFGSYTITGTITAHTFVPADSVGVSVYQDDGPGDRLRASLSVVVDMPEPDAAGYSRGSYTIRNVFPNFMGGSCLTVFFRSPAAPVAPFGSINGGTAFTLMGPPWTAPDEDCTYQLYYGEVTEPMDFTIDIDLGS